MGSVIGEISAVASLVEISGSVLSAGYSYISKVIRAPGEIRTLLVEVGDINAVLGVLLDQVQDPAPDPNALKARALQKLLQLGTISACETSLKEAQSAIKKCEQVNGHYVRNVAKRLLWPLKAKETTDLLGRLRNIRNSINAAIHVDSAASLQRIELAQSRLQDELHTVSTSLATEHEDKKLNDAVGWLIQEAASVNENLRDALDCCQENTGQWLLNSKVYDDWIGLRSPLLWVHGIPGSGKTSLCGTFVEAIQSGPALDPEAASLYFFYDRSDESKTSVTQLLATFINQLLHANGARVDDVDALVRMTKKSSKPTKEDLFQLFQSLSADFTRVYLFVDAIDEAKGATETINLLLEVSTKLPSVNWLLFLTSRNDARIQKMLNSVPHGAVALHDNNHAEVERYVTSELQRRSGNGDFSVRDTSLRQQVEDVIQKTSQGLFLQAKLQLDRICGLMTDKAIRRELAVLRPGLDSTYGLMLEQLSAEPRETVQLVSAALKCLSLSLEWIMGQTALTHAAAALVGMGNFDEDEVPSEHRLLEKCGSFVLLDPADDPVPSVWLAHLSMSEYFQSSYLMNGQWCEFYFDRKQAHSDLAVACITYISCEQVHEHSKSSGIAATLTRFPFYAYAAKHWSAHLKLAELGKDDFKDLILPHLDWFLSPIALGPFHYWREYVFGKAADVEEHPLMYAITLGLHHAFEILLSTYPDLDNPFPSREYPLTLAARYDSLLMVQRLVESGANIEVKGADRGLTALHIAAQLPNDAMVRYLLTRGASCDSRSVSKSTPFYRAARTGSLSTMSILRDAGADINARTYDDFTPLFETVEQQNHDAFSALLEWGADPFVLNADGDTAISFALWHGNDHAAAALGEVYSKAGRPIPSKEDSTEPSKIAWNVLMRQRGIPAAALGWSDPSQSHQPVLRARSRSRVRRKDFATQDSSPEDLSSSATANAGQESSHAEICGPTDSFTQRRRQNSFTRQFGRLLKKRETNLHPDDDQKSRPARIGGALNANERPDWTGSLMSGSSRPEVEQRSNSHADNHLLAKDFLGSSALNTPFDLENSTSESELAPPPV